ncbi:MAG: serine O-acetyltransferase [Xenococcus sp. (in: cyanobacteria)]
MTIFQHVTLGSHGKQDLPWSYPTIYEGTIIYVNSSVLGNITIGRNVIVGAHSLILQSVPDNSKVVGVPGKVIGLNEKVNSN